MHAAGAGGDHSLAAAFEGAKPVGVCSSMGVQA